MFLWQFCNPCFSFSLNKNSKFYIICNLFSSTLLSFCEFYSGWGILILLLKSTHRVSLQIDYLVKEEDLLCYLTCCEWWMSWVTKANEREITNLKNCRGCSPVKCGSTRLSKFNSICPGWGQRIWSYFFRCK